MENSGIKRVYWQHLYGGQLLRQDLLPNDGEIHPVQTHRRDLQKHRGQIRERRYIQSHHQNIKDFGISQKILEENILKFKGKRVILAAETVWFENLISLNRCDEAQAYLETSLERKNPILILELLSRKINSLSIEEIIEKAKTAHQLNNGYSIPRFNIYNDRFTEKLANKILETALPEIFAKKEISSDTFNFMINAIEFGCEAELIEKLIGILRQINDPRWQELTLKLAARDSEEKGGF